VETPADLGWATYKSGNLTDLNLAAPQLAFDIRYATADNFMGRPLYKSARAFLVRPAAEALIAAAKLAKNGGYGITIYDAYRPLSVTKAMWNATPRHLRNYVANPAKGSKHNRGAAVDVTLHDAKTNTPVPMPTDFDDFSKKAHRDYIGAPAEAIANRARLERYMIAAGFRPMSNEWWHFDFIGWEKFPILDVQFEDLDRYQPAYRSKE
jgi:zinc D-Ala-D-Ala dipeptidase